MADTLMQQPSPRHSFPLCSWIRERLVGMAKWAIPVIVSAIVGAVATYCVPQYLDSRRIQRSSLAVGEWMSQWRWDHEPAGEWHWETLQLQPRRGKIRIWTTYSPEGNDWQAEGRLITRDEVHGRHIIGSWWSNKPGAIASGPFVLTILGSHGESMYGYFGDFEDETGNPVVATWIMALDSTHVERAKRWITEHRTPQPSSEASGY